MAQDTSQNQFDIDCLRQIAADPDAQRVSLAAAMIKMHALAIARTVPELRGDALEIVRYSEQLYAGVPDRDSLARTVEDHPVSTVLKPWAIRDLVDSIWNHLRCGRNPVEVRRS